MEKESHSSYNISYSQEGPKKNTIFFFLEKGLDLVLPKTAKYDEKEQKMQELFEYSGFLKTCHPGVFSSPLFPIAPRSFCTRNVTCVTFLVQKLLGEMEKSGTEKTPGVTRFQKPVVR